MEEGRVEGNLNGEDMELDNMEENMEQVEVDLNSDPYIRMLLWMLECDIFGMHEGDGRDIVIAASDGTEFVAHTSKLWRLFREMALKGDPLQFSLQPVNFHFWEDGPTTKALLAFLNTSDKTLMEESSNVTFKLMMLGRLYKLDDLTAAALQVLTKKISTDVNFDDPEFLWVLNSWLVSLTDRNNGEVPPDLVALKAAISKVFNRNVANSRKQRIRSPAASQNMFGSFWHMNVNLLL